MQVTFSKDTHNTSLKTQLEEALYSGDDTKLQTLVALGYKISQIRNHIKNLKLEYLESLRATTSLKKLKEWKKQNKNNNLPGVVLKTIFANTESKALSQHLEFFINAGGNLETVSDYLKTIPVPTDLKKRAHLLNLLLRVMNFEKKLNLGRSYVNKEVPKEKNFARSIVLKTSNPKRKEELNNPPQTSRIKEIFDSILGLGDGLQLLHHSCGSRLNDLTIELIHLGVDIHSPFPGTGATLLHTAAYWGNVELVNWLIGQCASIEGTTLLTSDSSHSSSQNMRSCETPLHMAADQGHELVVEALIEAGANINAKTAQGFTPLHHATYNNSLTMTKLLISKGAKIDAQSNDGSTPLHYAAFSGNTEIVKLLLSYRADPTLQDNYLQTPLKTALEGNHKDLVLNVFKTHAKVCSILSTLSPKEFYAYCETHSKEFLVPADELNKSNPLEVALLFNDSILAKNLKILMTPSDFNAALKHLSLKYPNVVPKLILDANLIPNAEMIPYLDLDRKVPPIQPLSLDILSNIFGKIQFYYAKNLDLIEQHQVNFDKEDNIFRRRLTTPEERENGTSIGGIILDNKIARTDFEELKKISIDHLGRIKNGERVFPYIIARIGKTFMPVKLYDNKGGICIETRMELLLALYEKINFIDSSKPNFRDPKKIVDSGAARNAPPKIVTPEEVKSGLQALSSAINFRIPYTGTPSENNPKELENWYKHLELIVRHIIENAIKEDDQAKRSITSEGKISESLRVDTTPSAPTVIELGISGLHCGTRSLDDAHYLYDIKFETPKTIKDQVLINVEKLKLGIVHDMVDLSQIHNVHLKNKILRVVDEECGIKPEYRNNKSHFNDPYTDSFATKETDRKEIMTNFWKNFTPTALIDVVDQAINGKIPSIDRDLIIDWFKDHLPSEWNKEKYIKILEGLPKSSERQDKVDYLLTFDIFINPMILNNPEEPEWSKIIEGDRMYCYLSEEVQNQQTGKILRSALIYMLNFFELIK